MIQISSNTVSDNFESNIRQNLPGIDTIMYSQSNQRKEIVRK